MNAPTLQMRLKRIAKKLADLGQSNQANTIYEAINRINALENADSSPNSGEEFFFFRKGTTR